MKIVLIAFLSLISAITEDASAGFCFTLVPYNAYGVNKRYGLYWALMFRA